MIGVFDSGVGGLSVVKQIFKYLPSCQIIYFGDTARLPYGTKGEDFVKKYSSQITSLLIKKGAKIIVVACHTSSAWASDYLKEKYDVPIFEMITPTLKEVLIATKNKKVGIIGTPGTIKSETWKEKLLKQDPKLKIYSKACPLFVPLVEEGWINEEITQKVVRKYLKGFKDIDTLILACTHYPILKKVIKKEIKEIKIIDPAESLAKELKIYLKDHSALTSKITKGKKHQFFFSDKPYNVKKISKLCLGEEIKPEIIYEF